MIVAAVIDVVVNNEALCFKRRKRREEKGDLSRGARKKKIQKDKRGRERKKKKSEWVREWIKECKARGCHVQKILGKVHISKPSLILVILWQMMILFSRRWARLLTRCIYIPFPSIFSHFFAHPHMFMDYACMLFFSSPHEPTQATQVAFTTHMHVCIYTLTLLRTTIRFFGGGVRGEAAFMNETTWMTDQNIFTITVTMSSYLTIRMIGGVP